MFENLKRRFWSRYIKGSIELEKRRVRREERQRKQMMRLKQGTIRYGLNMKLKPVDFIRNVYETRQYNRRNKE